jgi:hypothetical protein
LCGWELGLVVEDLSGPGNAGIANSRDRGVNVAEFFISHMPLLSITKLPLELLLEITRNVTFDDLRRLRSVNSMFNTLVTPAVFNSITVYSDRESAETFLTLMHTPHIARHIESIDYVEGTLRQWLVPTSALWSLLTELGLYYRAG